MMRRPTRMCILKCNAASWGVVNWLNKYKIYLLNGYKNWKG
uniref:Uncharacterized protein n=1 Tax=Rhizophora mucronata TaxID=61149 RepID=A0A2P2NPI3_RHIMU